LGREQALARRCTREAAHLDLAGRLRRAARLRRLFRVRYEAAVDPDNARGGNFRRRIDVPAEPGLGRRIEIALLVVVEAAAGDDVQILDVAAAAPDLPSLRQGHRLGRDARGDLGNQRVLPLLAL